MTSLNEVEQEVYDFLEIEQNYSTENNFNGKRIFESEWTKVHPSGNSTVIEVFITPTKIELWRGEFNSRDVQIGAKSFVILKDSLTDEARVLISRKS